MSRLEELKARWLAGEKLGEAEATELGCHLESDLQARRDWLQDEAMDAQLRSLYRARQDGDTFAQGVLRRVAAEQEGAQSFQASLLERLKRESTPTWRERWLDWLGARRAWAMGVAMVLLVGCTIWVTGWHEHFANTSEVVGLTRPAAVAPDRAPAVAVLKRTVEVKWAGSGFMPSVGQMLPAGWLQLSAGTVQVEFLGGACLLVVGPAEVHLQTGNSAFLATGKASGYVPEPARGFRLGAPGLNIVDLGTAFGVEVSPKSASEVHVFDGVVSITPDQAPAQAQRLAAGRAVCIDNAGVRNIPLRRNDFPDAEDLARRDMAEGRAHSTSWKQAIKQLADDPATLLCYTFENEPTWSRTVTNHARLATSETHGALVGAGWTGGRWPGSRAIEFRSQGDRLRFTLPGVHAALTLIAWVRVDSLPNDYNALLMPSRYQSGALHWMLQGEGELRLSMLNDLKHALGPNGWDGPVNGTGISSMDYGRWVFLTTTYEAATGSVRHYRDGQLAGSGQFKHHLPALFGPMEFGNWGADSSSRDTTWIRLQKANQKVRNFIGRLDELIILNRALPAAEIARLYEIGKP